MKSQFLVFFVFFVCGALGDLTQQEIDEIIDKHNAARADVCLGPIEWDSIVAQVAQNYADGCVTQHNANRNSQYQALGGEGGLGENIAWGIGYEAPSLAQGWIDELDNPGWECGDGFSSGTGHYTQVVWGNSNKLGCGLADCSGGSKFLVCNYNPPGNVNGQAPFPETTEACSFSCGSEDSGAEKKTLGAFAALLMTTLFVLVVAVF